MALARGRGVSEAYEKRVEGTRVTPSIVASSFAAGLQPRLPPEPQAGDRVEDNINPVGRIFYSASTFVCVPNALSQEAGRRPLGAQAGEARLREVASATGFTRFRRATETPFNVVLEARPRPTHRECAVATSR